MVKFGKEFNFDECKTGEQHEKNEVGTCNYETVPVLA
jgi:hypothetical protein